LIHKKIEDIYVFHIIICYSKIFYLFEILFNLLDKHIIEPEVHYDNIPTDDTYNIQKISDNFYEIDKNKIFRIKML